MTEIFEEDIDEFLEHHGVKGMQWGVRRRGRVERTVNVGKGKGSTIDKARVFAKSNPIDLAKTLSFTESASRKGARFERRNTAMAKGEAKVVRDIIPSIGAFRYTDVVPSTRAKKLDADQKSNLAKMSSGKEAGLAVLALATGITIKALLKSSKG